MYHSRHCTGGRIAFWCAFAALVVMLGVAIVCSGCATVRADSGSNTASHERINKPGTVDKITVDVYGESVTPEMLNALPKFDEIRRGQ